MNDMIDFFRIFGWRWVNTQEKCDNREVDKSNISDVLKAMPTGLILGMFWFSTQNSSQQRESKKRLLK